MAFDEEVAKASGINVSFLNYMLVSLVAITVGLSIKIIGVLLIGALMIMPVISAMQFEKVFYNLFISSIFCSFSCNSWAFCLILYIFTKWCYYCSSFVDFIYTKFNVKNKQKKSFINLFI